MLVDAAQVRPRCPAQPVQAGRRQDRLRAAGVGQARVALDQAVEDEPVDQPRDAALAQDHAVGQLAHPDPPIGRVRDSQQGVVLGERQVVLGAQLLVEPPRDPGVGLEEGAPRFDALGRWGDSGRTSAPSVTVMVSMLHPRSWPD